MKSWPIRRSDTSRACAFSAAVTVLAPRVRPGRVFSGFVSGDAKVFSILPGEGGHGDVRARGETKLLRLPQCEATTLVGDTQSPCPRTRPDRTRPASTPRPAAATQPQMSACPTRSGR